MRYIGFDREDEATEWAKKQIGIDGPTGFSRAVSSVDEDGNFLLVVVFSNFTKRNVDTHVVVSDRGRKLTPNGCKEMFNGAFHYIFTELGAVRTTGLVRAKNKAARRFDEHLGYKLEGVMREAFDDDDLCVYGFLKKDFEEHRWYHGR